MVDPVKLAALRTAEAATLKALADVGSDLAERKVYLDAAGAPTAFLKLNGKTIEWPVIYAGKPK